MALPEHKRVAVIGECLVELNGAPFGSIHQTFGGDSLNTALYLARLAQGSIDEVLSHRRHRCVPCATVSAASECSGRGWFLDGPDEWVTQSRWTDIQRLATETAALR